MNTKILLAFAALAAAPLPAMAVTAGPPAEVSCQAVHANPSLYARHVVTECRRMGWSDAMGYAGMGSPAPIATRDSSCSDVRSHPGLYSESVRENCAAQDPRGEGDWGGAVVR